MDDISPLQQLSEKVASAEAHLFENPTRSAVINYYLGTPVTGPVRFEIAGVTGDDKRTLTVPTWAGINRPEWPMTFDPSPEAAAAFAQQQAAAQAAGRQGGGGGGPQGEAATPGEYRVTMIANGKTYTSKLRVREDPLLGTVSSTGAIQNRSEPGGPRSPSRARFARIDR